MRIIAIEFESNFQDVADTDSAIVSIIERFESGVEVNDLVLSELIVRFVHAIFFAQAAYSSNATIKE